MDVARYLSRKIVEQELFDVPFTIGEYAQPKVLGEGGMSIVCLALHPGLGRRVAIKLMKSSKDLDRLRREARALASLSHPNVVEIFDFGLHELEDGTHVPFIAMEHVPGVTLGEWQARERSWVRIMAMYVAAGRGLAAAHRQGIVHRDFKPSNVIVGEDGRPRVLDFGIARAQHAWSASGEAGTTEVSSRPSTPGAAASEQAMALTKTGTVAGTPLFMAPEQRTGQATDAASDQYSFCVALYEALYREHPFAGPRGAALTHASLAERAMAGEVGEPPRRSGVPSRLRKLLLRGLSPDPAARYPSMDALLDALERARRGRVIAWVAGGVVLGAGGLVGAALLMEDPVQGASAVAEASAEPDPCSGDDCPPGGSPDDPLTAIAAAALRGALQGIEHGRASGRYDELEPRAESVLALARVLGHEPVLAEALLAAGLAARSNGRAARALERLEEAYLLATRIEHDQVALQAALELVAVTGDDTSDVPEAETWIRHAESILARTDAPAEARAAWHDRLGLLHRLRGDYEAAVSEHALALDMLEQSGAPDELRLASIHDALASAQADAGRWNDALGHADLALRMREDLLGSLHPEVAAAHSGLGTIYSRMERYEESLRHHERALEIGKLTLRPEHPSIAAHHSNVGDSLQPLGRYDECLDHLRRAVSIHEANQTGAAMIAESRQNVARALDALGRLDEAIPTFEQALHELEEALGDTNPRLLYVLNNLSVAYFRTGKVDEAIALLRRALDIGVASLGDANVEVANLHETLASVLYWKGGYAEAYEHQRRALEIRRAEVPTRPWSLSNAHHNLGTTLAMMDRDAEALVELQQAVALARELPPEQASLVRLGQSLAALGSLLSSTDDRSAGPVLEEAVTVFQSALSADDPQVATALSSLGEHHLRVGRPRRALAVLERALSIPRPLEMYAGHVATTRFAAARALWAIGGDRARAVTLAEHARDEWAALAPDWSEDLHAVDAWLQRHHRPRTARRSSASLP
jgi:eukaryotic-like serine/threonine-protein kinase